MAEKHPLIRTIYLYLFTLIGLSLVVIGAVRFLDMGLKAFVFTKADEPEKARSNYYYLPPISSSKLEGLEEGGQLTDEELISLRSWLQDYQAMQEREAQIDYLASSRHRDASINLSLILVGLPLYLYHWRIIKKETREKA
jgi:hypothetical protein